MACRAPLPSTLAHHPCAPPPLTASTHRHIIFCWPHTHAIAPPPHDARTSHQSNNLRKHVGTRQRCTVHGTRHTVHGTWCMVHDSRRMAQGMRAHDTRHTGTSSRRDGTTRSANALATRCSTQLPRRVTPALRSTSSLLTWRTSRRMHTHSKGPRWRSRFSDRRRRRSIWNIGRQSRGSSPTCLLSSARSSENSA